MQEDNEKQPPETERCLADQIYGRGQKIIGVVEMIGGILTGDPNTAAEGEFNLEVGDLREDIEEEIESDDASDD